MSSLLAALRCAALRCAGNPCSCANCQHHRLVSTAHSCRLGDGFEFRIGEGGEGLMARGTLPKGTQRKYVGCWDTCPPGNALLQLLLPMLLAARSAGDVAATIQMLAQRSLRLLS